MVTEQEARDMDSAQQAFRSKDRQDAQDQDVIDLAAAQTWFDTMIKPTLTWNNTQIDLLQLDNTFADRGVIQSLRPVDQHRIRVLRKEIEEHDQRVRSIKERL